MNNNDETDLSEEEEQTANIVIDKMLAYVQQKVYQDGSYILKENN